MYQSLSRLKEQLDSLEYIKTNFIIRLLTISINWQFVKSACECNDAVICEGLDKTENKCKQIHFPPNFSQYCLYFTDARIHFKYYQTIN